MHDLKRNVPHGSFRMRCDEIQNDFSPTLHRKRNFIDFFLIHFNVCFPPKNLFKIRPGRSVMTLREIKPGYLGVVWFEAGGKKQMKFKYR
jgi:hypothetical protein